MNKTMMKYLIATLVASLIALTSLAQTAKDYFHQGAQQYIFGEKDAAMESVQAGLQIAPNDAELRELYELLMKEEEKEQNKNNKDQNQDQEKEDQQKEDQQQKQQEDQQQKQQSKPAQMSKEDLEKLLQALQMEEQKLQKEIQKRKVKTIPTKTEKDW